jgi:Asp-tRNA(Asn)/Glu-tRNA(Gln) amidotransferase A subunit family amidase
VPKTLETLRDWLDAAPSERGDALEMCLQRIRASDAQIRAWVQVAPQKPIAKGPLYLVPFGVKDVFETEGLVTEFGSPVYKGRKGTGDAALVRELRCRGAVLLGKTHTAAFAFRAPAPTRNPHNLWRTPGGSSSGSAAAVAAGMVPFALGTQTWGSILRPASYCGVTGFKPSYGLLPTEGMLPLGKSVDTAGLFTHTAEDMRLLWECLGHSAGPEETLRLGVPESVPMVNRTMEKAFQRCVGWLHAAGFSIQPVQIHTLLGGADAASQVIINYEAARTHQRRFEEHGSRLGPLADLVQRGLQISTQQYQRAKDSISRIKQAMAKVFEITPVILTPAATRAAPLRLASTGDPRMNAPWTALGTPAISIPMPVANGLPLGLQLTADFGHDMRLLQAAVRLEKVFGQGENH